jgi:class 3 adenylate cyclase
MLKEQQWSHSVTEAVQKGVEVHSSLENFDVNGFLDELGGTAREELKEKVEVEDVKVFPPEDQIFSEKRTWKRVKDVVAVVADLKNSTRLSFKRHPQTSARVYEAATGSCARMVEEFSPEFVDIQGDGLFALFHGEKARERALCAGVTIKTFSERHLVPGINAMPGSMPDNVPDETGFKVGLASGVLAVKKVGVRGKSEPVWAGKPVNWAAKCAQAAEAHQLIATSTVYDAFSDNDYVTHSCGCRGFPAELWSDTKVEKLPEENADCKVLRSGWCEKHGAEFCRAILEGSKNRPDI